MRILDIKIMRGPNYWSVRIPKLIVMNIDLGELEESPTDEIEGFAERLEKMFPSMYEHQCSENADGGFFKRVRRGTWMGHVIEHIAIEIQRLAGMDCRFGKTRGTGQRGTYTVVFEYEEARAGEYAARAAMRIALALVNGENYDLEADIQDMKHIRAEESLGPSTGSIVQEAVKRGIPYFRLNTDSLIQLGYGANQRRIQATVTSTTSNIAVEIACDKAETKNLLETHNIPVPRGKIVYREHELREAVDWFGYPIVIKPVNANHGKGATIHINNWDDAKAAFTLAQSYSRGVIVEKFIYGFDHRLLVINYKLVAASLRTPACVVGDGLLTVQQLIDRANSDPRRGEGHEKQLTYITIDEGTLRLLRDHELGLDSVPAAGQIVKLKATANLSTGGCATDVTDFVHPHNAFMAERIARLIGLDICGIDIMTPDISIPINRNGGAVLEVNASPGFRMHLAPNAGLPRNVAEPVLDMLYPEGSRATIPIVAVTGTNGKTTTTRLIAHIASLAGHRVGYTTTDGIYIQNRLVEKGDCTGPVSSAFVLKEPSVDFAVLECARGGILRAGLGFNACDIGIITNIAPDHLGLMGINTLEEMANVKSVVAESVSRNGYAILNADDPHCAGIAERLSSHVAYFSMQEHNPIVVKHCERGGLAAIVENGYLTLCKGKWKTRVEKVVDIPLTINGKADFNLQNVLPAALAAYIRNFDVEVIRNGINTFAPSHKQMPGRMNIFNFKDFTFMLDYAHNPDGLKALSRFLAKVDAYPKVGIISGVGDRRSEDTVEIGHLAAQMFDEIIIRYDEDMRGRTEEEISDLLLAGIHRHKGNKKVTVIRNELETIEYAIRNAQKGAFITLCSDKVSEAIKLLVRLKEEEDKLITESKLADME